MRPNYCFKLRYNYLFSLYVIFLLMNRRMLLPFEAAIPHVTDLLYHGMLILYEFFASDKYFPKNIFLGIEI